MASKEPLKSMDGTRRRGRPRVHREAWTKVSIVLFERQIIALDRFTAAVKRKSGVSLTRAEVIRALLDGLHRSRIDAGSITSGADLERLLLKGLARPAQELGI